MASKLSSLMLPKHGHVGRSSPELHWQDVFRVVHRTREVGPDSVGSFTAPVQVAYQTFFRRDITNFH